MKILNRIYLLLICFSFVACATSNDYDRAALEENQEFDDSVKIEALEEPAEAPVEEPSELAPVEIGTPEPVRVKKSPPKPVVKAEPDKTPITKKSSSKAKTTQKVEKTAEKKVEGKGPEAATREESKKEKGKAASVEPTKREPSIEDDVNFNGRRPLVEPYKVGEEVVLGISYFAVEAGNFTMKVMPMVQVNGRKSYHFKYIVKSSPLFSMFYRVDDVAETFVDYETLLPYTYEIHADESKQVRETKTFFDHKKKKATMWDRKKKEDGNIEKKKIEWDLLGYSQNVFSVPYYLRNFTLEVGKSLKVRVGHQGKNIIMSAKVLRKEKIYTDAGAFDTFVVQPSFKIEGKFKPTGENYLWLTADDRKLIVRLESKIKIGTIVGEVKKLKK